MEEREASQRTKLLLVHKLFLLRSPDVEDIEKASLKEEVLALIKADDMAGLYQACSQEFGWELDQACLNAMNTKNVKELKKLDKRIVDAEENLGESEVREALLAKALFYVRIGDKVKSLEQLKITEATTVAVGQKMDLVYHTLRLGFFHLDFALISHNIEKAKSLFAKGEDRERKNRLKVYERLYCMATRNLKQAAALFLDSISTFTSQTVEEVGIDSAVALQGKRKKKRERESTPLQTAEEVDIVGNGSGESKMKKKKKKNLNTLQPVEEVGTGSGIESQGKMRKKKKTESRPSETDEDVDEVGTGSGIELQGKRKKKKTESSPSETVEDVEEVGTGSGIESQGKRKTKKSESSPSEAVEDVDEVGTGSELQGKRKKKKRESSPSEAVEDVDEVGTGSELQGMRKKKKRESSPLEPAEGVDEVGTGNGSESQGKRKKKKKENLVASQTVKDCVPETGTAKKTILKTQELQTGNGAEPVRKKKVSFQLPDATQDDPSENEVPGEETEMQHTFTDLESSPWLTDKFRPDLVYGMYTPGEDQALKQAIYDYIQEQGWDREDGLQKILNSGSGEARRAARGCWSTIRKCLPQREIKRIHARAHRLFDPGNYLGKWTSEETQSLIELHSVHGNNWKKISTIIGRDALNCKDKWRSVKSSSVNGPKTGSWSKEEQQKLCALVLKCLHVKRQMVKKGQLKKDHRVVRDDINWEFIAEQMDGRNRIECLNQWYRRMASPMVTTGEWSNGDDQRLLERLMEEFPLSEELVEWDSLLEHRSGETCRRRWEQMQYTIGRGPALRHLHFLEKLENLVTRFAPNLLDAEYDQQFAVELQRADADESEDVDNMN